MVKLVFTRMKTSVEMRKQRKDSTIFPCDTGKFAEQCSSTAECCILTNNQCHSRLFATYVEEYFENVRTEFPSETILRYLGSVRNEQKVPENGLCCQSNVF